MKKIMLGCKSILLYLKYKLLYGKRIQIATMNSLKGKVSIELFNSAKCRIGNFLMTAGPFYAKCTDSAEISIGNNCFFNHNCSLTAAERITIGDNCMFANNLVVVDHDHVQRDGKILPELVSAPVKIGNNVWSKCYYFKRDYGRRWCSDCGWRCRKQKCRGIFYSSRSAGT